jgi:hypothetical protein
MTSEHNNKKCDAKIEEFTKRWKQKCIEGSKDESINHTEMD